MDPLGDPGSDCEVYLQILFMPDGVPGHEVPDLSRQVNCNIKRRAPPLLVLSILTTFNGALSST